jgi:hypothetical protein
VRLSSTRIHSALRRSTLTAALPAAWGELYLITQRRLLHSDCLGSCCNDFRFLSDLYLKTTIHFLKLNASQNQEQGKYPSSEGVASPPMTSPEQHDPPEITIPSMICDMPGCSATITLEHGTSTQYACNTWVFSTLWPGTLRSLSGLARLASVALYRLRRTRCHEFPPGSSAAHVRFRCTLWLGQIVNSKALSVIQHGGLDDVARTLQTVVFIVTRFPAASQSPSASSLQACGLYHLSDDEKMQIAESQAPVCVLFHSAASPPLVTHLELSSPPTRDDNSVFLDLLQSCCRSCCRMLSSALDQAIAAAAVPSTWNHSAAARLCLNIACSTRIDNNVLSSSVAVIGEC